jgi:4-amino-4-deoxy-L-arabinose transferase-like glycosyltransferase
MRIPDSTLVRRVSRLISRFASARVSPCLLTLIAFSLRIYHIGQQSIWRDEGISLHLASSSIPAILANRASNVHPPLYFVLVRVWTVLGGLSELSVRFFSLIFGVLLIPALYFTIRKIFDQKTALATTAIAAFSPLYVVYSQEARVYILMPLAYLVLIYKLWQLDEREVQTRTNWVELAAVEVLCLYLHYFSVFVVASMNLYLALSWLRRRGVNFRRWFLSQAGVALACVPWVWMVLGSYQSQGAPQDYFAGPLQRIGILETITLVWHFFNGGKDLRGHGLFTYTSCLVAVSLVVALAFAFRVERRRKQLLVPLYHWIAPLSMAFGVWWLRPMVHPRYVLMFSIPLFILMGRAMVVTIGARGPSRLAGMFLATALTAALLLGLGIAHFDRAYFKDDVRGLVQHLEPLTSANTVIVVHPSDHAVGYYYDGPAAITMVDPDDAQGMAAMVRDLGGKSKVFVVWPFGVPVGRVGQLPFQMEMGGRLVDRKVFKGYRLTTYQLEEPASVAGIQPLFADFGIVQLTGVFYQPEVRADGAICVALRWQLVEKTSKGYKATIILWDDAGRSLSSRDMLLKNQWGLATDRWSPGDESVNYYVVPVPLGTPPLPCSITAGVYDAANLKSLSFVDEAGNPAGVNFQLGQARLTRARDFERDPYGTRSGLSLEALEESEVADGLALEGFAVSARPTTQTISVTLRWRALRDRLPRHVPYLRLRYDGALSPVVGSSLFEERYPTSEWAQGEVVFEQRRLVYPPSGDRAVIEIELDGKTFRLTEIVLDTIERAFLAPQMQHVIGVRFGGFAELLGYDVDKVEVTTGEKVGLTLYWKAINDAPLSASYTVFAHLLSDEGRLIGQHDGKPAGGTRPTMSWVSGEVIADRHEMIFTDQAYQGKAVIEVGLYDSLTIQRVTLEDGRDYIVFPTEVLVGPAE